MSQAVKGLRDFWFLGADSLALNPTFPRGRNRRKADELVRLNVSVEKLRLARIFASRCNPAELNERIAEARAAQYPPHWSVLAAIYAIEPEAARLTLWKAAMENRLSAHEALLRARAVDLPRHARPATSGRKIKVPQDPALALQRVKELTGHWEATMGAAQDVLQLTPSKRRAFQQARSAMGDFLKRLA